METLKFKTAFHYPFNKAKAMWNILWILLPIIGWFALGGYTIRIVNEFMKGKYKELPKMTFSDDLSLGFMMFLKSIPFILAYMAITMSLSLIDERFGSVIEMVLSLLIIPILGMNFIKKQTIGSFFEFKLLNHVFNNFGDYLIALLKDIGLGLIFLMMWIILIGIPAGAFTKNIFMANFYGRYVK